MSDTGLENTDVIDFADDLLEGADEIGFFMFKDKYPPDQRRRKVYHLAETSNVPFFKIGAKLCARRSVLVKWMADQEARRMARGTPQDEK